MLHFITSSSAKLSWRTIVKSMGVFERLGTLPTRTGATWSALAQRDGAALFAVSGC